MKFIKTVFPIMIIVFIVCYFLWNNYFRNYSFDDVFEGIEKGNIRPLKSFLKRNPGKINDLESTSGYSFLHYAVIDKRKEIILFLLKNGADVNVRSSILGRTSMHEIPNDETIYNILIDNGADINIKDKSLITPLEIAVYQEKDKILELMLKKVHADQFRDRDGTTLLHTACDSYMANEAKDFKMIDILLRHKIDINVKDSSGYTPLLGVMYVTDPKNISLLEYLIKRGADINARDIYGRTVLHIAASRGLVEFIKFYLGKGMNVDCRDKRGRTPLFDATDNGRVDAIKYLVKRGAEIKAVDLEKSNPLYVAVLSNPYVNKEAVEALISCGADVNQIDSSGRPLLFDSIFITKMIPNKIEIVKLLVDKGANINIKNEEGITPLSFARSHGLKEVVGFLKSRGAKE